MVNKPLIRPAISWGGVALGGVARIPLIIGATTSKFIGYYITHIQNGRKNPWKSVKVLEPKYMGPQWAPKNVVASGGFPWICYKLIN